MSEEARPPGSLCYPGKRIELHHDGKVVEAAVDWVDGQRVGIGKRVPSYGPCELMLVFFGERFIANGIMMPAVAGTEVVVEADFVPINIRSAPRVNVSLAGTYYLRPPSVGIPMEIVDLSVSGVAISPILNEDPSPGQRRMISFGLNDREIKTVIELVAIEADRWRARFLKLALSDEDAIAGFVMGRQVHRRNALSALEVRTSSSLDLETRLEFPLIESIDWTLNACTLGAGSVSGTVIVPSSPDAEREHITSLVGVARLGDPRDFAHLLRRVTLDVVACDSVMAAYLVVCARYRGISVAELLVSWVHNLGEPSVQAISRQLETLLLDNGQVGDRSTTARPSSQSLGCSCGMAVARGGHGDTPPVLPSGAPNPMSPDRWVDPIAFVVLIQQLGLAEIYPIWPTLTANDDGMEVVLAFTSLAVGGSYRP
jgi:hypothetical protein